jgi:tetratricopeptide (TPR) repeat protein
MKVIHKSISPNDFPKTFSLCVQHAQEQENQENIKEAIAAYEKCIQLNPNQELPYNRLMILYRKQKEPLKELKIIQQAIKAIKHLLNQKSLQKKLLV